MELLFSDRQELSAFGLHQALKDRLPSPRTVFGCWAEMIAIAKGKDTQPTHEYVPVGREQIERGKRIPIII